MARQQQTVRSASSHLPGDGAIHLHTVATDRTIRGRGEDEGGHRGDGTRVHLTLAIIIVACSNGEHRRLVSHPVQSATTQRITGRGIREAASPAVGDSWRQDPHSGTELVGTVPLHSMRSTRSPVEQVHDVPRLRNATADESTDVIPRHDSTRITRWCASRLHRFGHR